MRFHHSAIYRTIFSLTAIGWSLNGDMDTLCKASFSTSWTLIRPLCCATELVGSNISIFRSIATHLNNKQLPIWPISVVSSLHAILYRTLFCKQLLVYKREIGSLIFLLRSSWLLFVVTLLNCMVQVAVFVRQSFMQINCIFFIGHIIQKPLKRRSRYRHI